MTARLCDAFHNSRLVLAAVRVEVYCDGEHLEILDVCEQCRGDLANSAAMKRDGIVAVEVVSVYRVVAVAG